MRDRNRVFKRQGTQTYYARFYIKNREFLRTTGKRTEREARAEVPRLKAQARKELAEIVRAGERLTLDQAFGRYNKHEVGKLSPNWGKEVKRYMKRLLEFLDPEMLIEDLSDYEVDEWVQEQIALEGGTYALNRSLDVLRRIHNVSRKKYKQRTQEIEWDEFRNAEDKRVRSITKQEGKRLLNEAYGISDRLGEGVEWSLLTGCRRSETYSLSPDQIDVIKGCATVTAKGGAQHVVWLSQEALDLLARMPKRAATVFDGTNRRKEWELAVKRAGLEDYRWHDLRHTFATWMRQSDVALEIVQRALGHTQLRTTERYAHVVDDEVRQAMQKLGSIAGSPTTGKVVSIRKQTI